MYFNYAETPANLSSTIGAALGTLGNLVIIWSCYRYPQLRNAMSTRLILHQTWCLLIESCTLLLFPSRYYPACILQGPLVEYSIISNALWSCVTCYVLLQMTQSKIIRTLLYKPEDDMFKFKLICYLCPIPLTIAPLISGTAFLFHIKPMKFCKGDYGLLAGGWCWIRTGTPTGRHLRDAHYFIVWILVMYNVVASGIVYFKVKPHPDTVHATISSFFISYTFLAVGYNRSGTF